MSRLDSLYCSPLTDENVAQLRALVRSHRGDLLARHLGSVEILAKELEQGGDAVQTFLLEILGLSEKSRERFAEIVAHWAPSFFLARLLEGVPGAERQHRIASLLLGMLVCQRLVPPEGVAASDRLGELSFETAGDLVGLLRDGRIRTPLDDREGPLTWSFGDEEVTVSAGGTSVRSHLPATDDGPLRLEPLPRAESWGIPIFERIEDLGLPEYQPPKGAEHYGADWEGLPLAESLEGAHQLFADLWPEVLAWARVLVPAFVDMGGPPSQWVHRSETYGGNSPIFLSKADSALTHATDIVHELQHLRLYLLLPESAFGGWNDLRQRLISPYRSDPRPSRGLILGLHAFLAVNEIRLRFGRRDGITPHLATAMLKTHRLNLFAYRSLLEHETFEGAGRRLMADMGRTLCEQHGPIEAAVDAETEREVARRFDEHRASVVAYAERHRTGPVENAGDEYVDWSSTVRKAAEMAGAEAVSAS